MSALPASTISPPRTARPPPLGAYSPSVVPIVRSQGYPLALGEKILTMDARSLHLRGIRPSDREALQRCFARLSPQDIRRRFMHAMSELPPSMAHRMCHVDAQSETALVLMDETVVPGEMRGAGRIYVDEAANSAEFSILVEQSWSRRGLGALLLSRLIDDCRQRGLDEIWGYVLIENRPMLQLCKELGFSRRLSPDEPGTALISLLL